MASLSKSDIDAIYNAIRPRLKALLTGGVTVRATVTPHTHSADQISFEPEGRIASEECQASQEELDEEKLARDGTQPMLGDLDMYQHEIDNITNLNMNGGVGAAKLNLVRRIIMTGIGLIEKVKKIDFTGSGVGDGVIDQPRVIHMDGDDDDNEARIDGLERVVFNDEVTKSVIQRPSMASWNTGVTPGTHYTPAVGNVSWSTTEATMVVTVESG